MFQFIKLKDKLIKWIEKIMQIQVYFKNELITKLRISGRK